MCGLPVEWLHEANKIAEKREIILGLLLYCKGFIVVPHSLIPRWLALLYYLYYLRLAALSKAVWNNYMAWFAMWDRGWVLR